MPCVKRSCVSCEENGCYQNPRPEANIAPSHALVSSVIITPSCSSETVKTLDEFKLVPDKFNINGKWKNL